MRRSMLVVLLLCAAAFAGERHLVPQATFDAIARELSGELAQENTRRIVEFHRIQGSPMMADVAEQVVLPALKSYGLEAKVEQFPSDGRTKYGTFISPAGWQMRSGELWVTAAGGDKDFQPYPVCRYADVPMCVSSYSKGGTWEGELVEVGAGTKPSDYENKDVRGKVALAYGYAANVVREAVLKHGAAGVVIYPPPGDRANHPDMTRYNGIWPRAEEFEQTRGGFQVSQNAYTKIEQLMRSGPVRVKGTIDADFVPGKLTLVHAWIRGTENPEQEVILVGHLDHPKWSANDNASGSGALLDIARTYTALIKAGKLPAPKKTLHFMWVPEFFGTMAYVANHPEIRRCGGWDDPRAAVKPWPIGYGIRRPDNMHVPCVVAALNLDMVGEDTVKTNSRFYFTRTPDSMPPVGPLREESASYLNALLRDALAQTRAAGLTAPTGTRNLWVPEEIGLALGSDHEVFLGLGIPATMLGHDPDWTHHSSEDKMDKTDPTEFKRVATFAAAVAWWMATADAKAVGIANQLQLSDDVRTRTARIVSAKQTGLERGWQLNFKALNSANDLMRSNWSGTGIAGDHPGATAHGPRRLVLVPIDASALESVSEADKKWLDEQRARFAVEAEGITDQPNFDLLLWETVNLMDGHRSTAELADLLAAEYLVDVDQAWVDRLVGILASQKLVAPK